MILLIISFMDFRPFLQGTIISYLIDTLQRFFTGYVTNYELSHGTWDIVLQNVLDCSG